MPRRGTHQVISAICGAAFAYAEAKQAGTTDPFWETLGGGLAGLVTGTTPDDLEPATSPCHRASAHSIAAAGLVTLSLPPLRRFAADCRKSAAEFRALGARFDLAPTERNNYAISEALSSLAAGFATGLPAGYLSHLGADAFTPRGLPLG
jgi:membrane-bound metal-dependent hydrolase YbcI (DUF457 family)